jgi:CBS domain-containing protein
MISYANDDIVPIRIRTRRTLAGNGEFEIASTVCCGRRAAEVPLETCVACEHCNALISTRSGREAHVLCHDSQRAREAVVHLPATLSRATQRTAQSLADCTPLSAIMTTEVLCVRADVSVEAVTALLLERAISGIPVVDDRGKPLGVISKTDLVRESAENEGLGELGPPTGNQREIASRLGGGFHATHVARATVSDVMAGITFALPESATIAQAAALMAYEGVHRLPVTCSDGKVVGIVSSLDILRWLTRQGRCSVRE